MYVGGIGHGNGGRGQVFMFMTFIIFVFIFTFYKNVLKRDKEIKKHREDAIRKQIEADILYENELKLRIAHEIEQKRQQNIRNKMMKEYDNVCYDLYIFSLVPEFDEGLEITDNDNSLLSLFSSSSSTPSPSKKLTRKHRSFLSNEETEEQMKARRSMVSGPIVYLFVIVLIYSLIKATTEISQHFRKKAAGEGENRRCSLQEYASIKHERKYSKAFTRRSTVLGTNIQTKYHNNRLTEERRISHAVIQEMSINSGQITEPGSPAKITSGLASKPAPLLRRCSVPAFAMGVGLRRTSMDSFSEDDSSPDVKRRVRMIHRH